jgi:microcystin-dependent protein
MEPFIGQIMAVGFNFAPRGWAFCDGRLMSIAQNSALFSLLGTTYGGDGIQTFALPDYRSRSPVGMGQGPGLSMVSQGQVSGTEQVTMLPTQMPMHTHTATGHQPASTATATETPPAGNIPAVVNDANGREPALYPSYALPSGANTSLAPLSITVTPSGGNQPMGIRNPYLGTNFIIATEGIFPSRP